MMTLYDSKLSGNSWKVRLALRHLGIPFRRETLNLAAGAHKTPAFAERSRYQRVPALELDTGEHLVESNAILLFLAEGTALMPAAPAIRAAVLEWLFFEQADLLRFLAYPRFFAMTGQSERQAAVVEHYMSVAASGLEAVERTLGTSEWIIGSSPSIADFALYPYLRLCSEGGYSLARCPAIIRWMARFEGLRGYESLVPEVSA